jgi:hypothetical protein
MWRRLIFVMFVVTAGCEDLILKCTEDRVCTDRERNPGLCIYDGKTGRYCAIPTQVCPSKYRWDGSAPKAIEGKCVDPALIPVDGGTDAAGDGAGG